MRSISLKTTVALTVGAAFAALAETTVTDEGNVRTYNVPLNETYQESALFPESALTVVKTGGGTLEVLAANTSRKSALTFEIREGYVKTAISADPFGGENTLIKVSKGAALWYTGDMVAQKSRTFYSLEIAGEGPDGKGAFYRTGSSGGDCLITNLKLTDGATIGGDRKFGVRYTDLNFHTLTNKVVSSTGETLVYASHEYGSHVKSPGNIVQLSNVVTVDGLKLWDGVSDDNSWTVSTTSFLDFFQQSVPFPWEVKAEASPTFRVFKDAEMLRGIKGVNAGLTLTLSGLYKFVDPRLLTIRGAITNLALKKESAVLDVSLLTNDHYFTKMDINGGTVNIVGGNRQSLVNAWNTSYIKSGGTLRLEDAGDVFSDMGYIAVCNSSFADTGKASHLDVSGNTRWFSTVRGSGGNSYLYSMVFLGQQRDVYGTATINATGWGSASIRDGAVVTNTFKVGAQGVGALTVEDSELSQWNASLEIATHSAPGYGYLGLSNSVFTTRGDILMASAEGSEAHYVQLGGVSRNNACGVKTGGAGYANFYLGDSARYDTSVTYVDATEKSYFHLGYNFADRPTTGGESILTVDGNAELVVNRINLLSRAGALSQVNLNRGGSLAAREMRYSNDHSRDENSRLLFSFDGGKLKYPFSWVNSPDFLADSPDQMVVHGGGAEIEVAANSSVTCRTPLERPVGKSIKSITLPTDAEFMAATNIGPARIIVEGIGEGASAFASYDSRRGVLDRVVVTSPGTGYDDATKAYVKIPALSDRRFECAVELMEETGGDFVKSGAGTVTMCCTNTYAGATVVKGGQITASCHWAFPSNTVLRMESGAAQLQNYKAFFECIEGVSGNVYCYLASPPVINVRRLSVNAGAGVKIPDSVTMKVHGSWKVKAADIAAAKSEGRTSGYSCNVEFVSGATIEFDGTEGLSKAHSPYVLCALPEGKRFTGRPVFVNAETLGERWAFSMSGSMMSLKYRNPFAVIIR